MIQIKFQCDLMANKIRPWQGLLHTTKDEDVQSLGIPYEKDC